MVEYTFEAGRTALRRFGHRVGARARPGDVIALVGGLGVGKTFLAQHLAHGVGVPPSARITSPTFTLVHEYLGTIPFFHADLYRLEHPDELHDLGLFERGMEGLVVLEWADRFREHVPPGALWVTLTSLSPSIRRVHVQGEGLAAQRLLLGASPAGSGRVA
jgi:tRNA threonylcarbamoyladenosine biosynthesis protein TsaE